jgi:hypothetical protein
MRDPPLPTNTKVADRRHQDAVANRARAQARRPKKLLQTISNRGEGGNQVFRSASLPSIIGLVTTVKSVISAMNFDASENYV